MAAYNPILSQLVAQAPALTVWLVGILLAARFWRRLPAISLLTGTAVLIRLVQVIVDTYLNVAWIPNLVLEYGVSEMNRLFFTITIANAVTEAIVYGLLLSAIFLWRTERRGEPG